MLEPFFDLDQHIAILPVADVEEFMRRAGFAPQHAADGFVGFLLAAILEIHDVLAFGHRHDDVRQIMLVPGLAFARIELHAPDADVFVLEQDLVADRPKLRSACSMDRLIAMSPWSGGRDCHRRCVCGAADRATPSADAAR